MNSINSLCVFCGSKSGFKSHYEQAARKLGKLFLKNGIQLIYGGGRTGLMGTISNTILAGGGRVTGVIPSFLEETEVGNQEATESHAANDQAERAAPGKYD